MTSTLEPFGPAVALTVAYESVDITTSRAFRADLDKALEGHGPLVVDLGRVRFIDSAGLGALLTASRVQHARRQPLVLCRLTPPIQALFELLRMDLVFDAADTREHALALMPDPALPVFQ
jgi:anti-sigma B factor antagonist